MQIPTGHVNEDQLPDLAREAYEEAKSERGVTQRQIAEALGVSQPTISNALKAKSGDTRFSIVQRRIVEACGGYQLSGCEYKVQRVNPLL